MLAIKKSHLSVEILNEFIKAYDSLGVWNSTFLNIPIQEPRVSNPYRYTILKLDNAKNTFELSRNRDQYISKNVIESNGKSYTLIDKKGD